jgi:hypothetical protein
MADPVYILELVSAVAGALVAGMIIVLAGVIAFGCPL